MIAGASRMQHKNSGSSAHFHVESQRNNAASPTSTSLLMLGTYEQNIESVVIEEQKVALSQQIADLESTLEEQAANFPVDSDHPNQQEYKAELMALEDELMHLQQQFTKATHALEEAKEQERERLYKVQVEASEKVRKARSEGREVSEKVRIDLTKRLSQKERELLEKKMRLAESEKTIDQWSNERASIKGLTGQAWQLVRRRWSARGDRLKAKAAVTSARNRDAFSEEWKATRDGAVSLARGTGKMIKSCVRITLLLTPFVGSKVLVASGSFYGRIGGKAGKK